MADQNSSNYDEEEYSIMTCNLPKDAVVQILLRLPIKALLRFRSVCKAWYNFLKSPNFIKSVGPQISLNGFVYWLATGAVECIICFDLIKDEFKLVDVPDDCGFVRELVRRRLMVLRESLAMMVSVEDGSSHTEIWVLVNKISGLKPYSWTKEFIIEPFSKMTIPLGMWNADKLLVVVLQTRALKQVYSYDLVTKKIDYSHVPKEQDLESFALVRGRYFESLELEDGYGQRY
ncbi:hypothetical protein RND71_013561 [Anisodus tanguticus]|uniref:F-box domain-containing protein n=1 Tax=Anisodus tanguticus TaxID=243964 RepID=A0AAE1VJ46_9SOLA|nr:hypothetical protein RND71_013561 [Anisodus tanguticus]